MRRNTITCERLLFFALFLFIIKKTFQTFKSSTSKHEASQHPVKASRLIMSFTLDNKIERQHNVFYFESYKCFVLNLYVFDCFQPALLSLM